MAKKGPPTRLKRILDRVGKLPAVRQLPDLSSRLSRQSDVELEETHQMLYEALAETDEFRRHVWSVGAWNNAMAEAFSKSEPGKVRAQLPSLLGGTFPQHLATDRYRDAVEKALREYEFVRSADTKFREIVQSVESARMINSQIIYSPTFIPGSSGIQVMFVGSTEGEGWKPVADVYKDAFTDAFDVDEEDRPDLRYLRICPNPDCLRVFWSGWLPKSGQPYHSARCRSLLGTRRYRARQETGASKEPRQWRPNKEIMSAIQRAIAGWPPPHNKPFSPNKRNIRELAEDQEITSEQCEIVLEFLKNKRAETARKTLNQPFTINNPSKKGPKTMRKKHITCHPSAGGAL